MDKKDILKKYDYILNDLVNYVLIKEKFKTDNREVYTIFCRATNGILMAEENHAGLVNLMLEKGAIIYDDLNNAKNPDYIRTVMFWDEEKKEMIEMKETEIEEFLKKRKGKKG